MPESPSVIRASYFALRFDKSKNLDIGIKRHEGASRGAHGLIMQVSEEGWRPPQIPGVLATPDSKRRQS